MTGAGALLRAAEALPATTDVGIVIGAGGAVVLAPHPDDESIGCGGLIALAVAAGRRVQVVVLSDGTGSHPGVVPAALRALRETETRAAVAALGLPPAAIGFLGLHDTALPSEGPACDGAAAAVLAALRGCPTAVVTTWRHDPHRDHVAAFAIAERVAAALPAARLVAFPVWGWAFAHRIEGFPMPREPKLEPPPRAIRLDIAAVLPAKRQAIAAHASQVTDVLADPAGFRLPPQALALADRPFEVFFEEAAT